MDTQIRAVYDVLGNHRAVAKVLGLPIHVVMFALGLMSPQLFKTVNGD